MKGFGAFTSTHVFCALLQDFCRRETMVWLPFVLFLVLSGVMGGGPVELTEDTFDLIVSDESKDVIVYWWAPWCGHCLTFNAIYEGVADKFADKGDVVVAKMVCAALYYATECICHC